MDSENLISRVKDCVSLCFKSDVPRFLGFLSAAEAAEAELFLRKSGAKYSFFGGYGEAERRYLGVFPKWCESADFPIDCVTVSYPKAYSLTHRDFLGALMGLGISRESVGDILVSSGTAVAFLSKTITEYVLSEIKKVGSVGVKLSVGMPEVLPEVSKKITVRDTVSSLRLDCVVAAMASVSRSAAQDMIADSRVSVNSFVCQKPVRTVAPGDNITVRGKGGFTVISSNGQSKKGKTILIYSKFV